MSRIERSRAHAGSSRDQRHGRRALGANALREGSRPSPSAPATPTAEPCFSARTARTARRARRTRRGSHRPDRQLGRDRADLAAGDELQHPGLPKPRPPARCRVRCRRLAERRPSMAVPSLLQSLAVVRPGDRGRIIGFSARNREIFAATAPAICGAFRTGCSLWKAFVKAEGRRQKAKGNTLKLINRLGATAALFARCLLHDRCDDRHQFRRFVLRRCARCHPLSLVASMSRIQ